MCLPPVAAFLVAALIAGGLSACATVETRTAFDDSQKAFARRQVERGAGRVTGHAFFHADTGRTYTAAGDWVRIIPATDYARERLTNLFGSQRMRRITMLSARPDSPDPAYVEATRVAKADIGGRFEFEDVMPGRWFIIAYVSWTRQDVAYTYEIFDEFEVVPGETTKVVLSGR